MAREIDILKTRLENTRRSTEMLRPHTTVTFSREEIIDLLDLLLALSDQVRGRGASAA